MTRKGIEMYNKIKVSYDADYPVTMVKARSISPAGKVIELKSTDFKDIKNEEGGMQKIFALEGVEKGSEVEYIIFQQQRFMPFGAEYMQDVMPTVESVFELVSPKNFIFEVKGYNQAKTDADTMY
jgi:predicted HAD superfamily hydrolase